MAFGATPNVGGQGCIGQRRIGAQPFDEIGVSDERLAGGDVAEMAAEVARGASSR
jgi:hypothetical protein